LAEEERSGFYSVYAQFATSLVVLHTVSKSACATKGVAKGADM